MISLYYTKPGNPMPWDQSVIDKPLKIYRPDPKVVTPAQIRANGMPRRMHSCESSKDEIDRFLSFLISDGAAVVFDDNEDSQVYARVRVYDEHRRIFMLSENQFGFDAGIKRKFTQWRKGNDSKK
jgi:hypothetical protein